MEETKVQVEFSRRVGRRGIGRRIAISTSKTKKIIAIIKNRREKGIRAEEKGSNPHSKGEDFSRSRIDFLLIIEAIIIITEAISRIIRRMMNKEDIIFPALQSFSLEVKDTKYTRKIRASSVNGNIKE
mgnify:CR=1 FL=1